nr:F-box protein SKIP28 [Ipomoea trifida]
MMVKSCAANESEEEQKEGTSEQQFGPPPEAMFLVLAYLPLYELLCMSKVCRSLRDAVKGDILPWLNIAVEAPLHSRISDDILMKITAVADGRLATLALLNCFKVTDDGLLRVIQKNPRITKLYIPGCTGITPEGVIKAVQLLTNTNQRLKTLKISGIYNITKEHLQTLCNLLGKPQNHHHQNPNNFYHNRRDISAIRLEEDDPFIDIDECPKCGEIRAVFDCPRESCICRGCIICIRRCEDCGVCVVGEEDEQCEAACADDLCLGCWLRLPKCSFCNRPYCHQHSNQQCRLPGYEAYEGFLCVICNDNFVQNSSRLLSMIYIK